MTQGDSVRVVIMSLEGLPDYLVTCEAGWSWRDPCPIQVELVTGWDNSLDSSTFDTVCVFDGVVSKRGGLIPSTLCSLVPSHLSGVLNSHLIGVVKDAIRPYW